MDVSVIRNSQARIYRAELAYRVNRCCIGSEFISNRISFYEETTLRNEINLCCSQISIRCEAVVSDKAPFLKSTPRTRPLKSVRLFVGLLPLDTVSDCNTVNHTKALAAGLRALKLLGVEGVELPIFWGVAEKESPGNYRWSGYLAIAEMVKKTGLKLHVSLCFHGSKQPNIPLPDWVTRIGETEPGIYFTDRSGIQYKECLSFGLDDVPALDGKTPIEVYRGFLESFKSAFSDYLGNTITGITIGLRPEGELRYPSYQTRKLSDGAGEFQCYDRHMLAALKHYAEASGNPIREYLKNYTEPILGGFEGIIDNLSDENATIDLFTYQRMGAHFFSPDHFHAFTEFVQNLSQFKLPEDDLQAEEEEENAEGKTLTTSISFQ